MEVKKNSQTDGNHVSLSFKFVKDKLGAQIWEEYNMDTIHLFSHSQHNLSILSL